MSAVFHRHLSRRFPTAVSGQGVRLRDSEGNEYIDASGGAAVSCLGHGHPDVLQAMHAQIDKLAYIPMPAGPSARSEPSSGVVPRPAPIRLAPAPAAAMLMPTIAMHTPSAKTLGKDGLL